MPVKALDTRYNGYKFTSRLEARWAVFFDRAGIPYLYESDDFDAGGGLWYQPNFYLKQGIRFLGEGRARQEIWAEIRPALDLSEDERQEIAGFVGETGNGVLLIAGEPGIEAEILFIYQNEEKKLVTLDAGFMELADGRVGMVAEDQLQQLVSRDDQALVGQQMQTDLLVRAFRAARKSRFDRRRSRKLPAGEQLLAGVPLRTRRIAAVVIILVVILILGWSMFTVVSWADGWAQMAWERAEQARATETPGLPATFTPLPTMMVTSEALVPGLKVVSNCGCAEDLYDCSDFVGQEQAQACYERCRPSAGDVHFLDDDGDGIVCALLP